MPQYSGRKLTEIVSRQGRRAYWLAEQAEVSPSLIYRLMNGERSITPDMAGRLSEILGIEAESLLAEDMSEKELTNAAN